MFIDSNSSVMLERALSGTWQRAQMISHNIANQDTPGFKALRTDFETQLRSAMERNNRTNPGTRQERHDRIRNAASIVRADVRTSYRIDGNNVNSDAEHIELARVQLQYQAIRDRLNGHFNTMRTAITGGR